MRNGVEVEAYVLGQKKTTVITEDSVCFFNNKLFNNELVATFYLINPMSGSRVSFSPYRKIFRSEVEISGVTLCAAF